MLVGLKWWSFQDVKAPFFFRMAKGNWGPHLCSPFEVLQILQLVGASEKKIFWRCCAILWGRFLVCDFRMFFAHGILCVYNHQVRQICDFIKHAATEICFSLLCCEAFSLQTLFNLGMPYDIKLCSCIGLPYKTSAHMYCTFSRSEGIYPFVPVWQLCCGKLEITLEEGSELAMFFKIAEKKAALGIYFHNIENSSFFVTFFLFSLTC